MEGPRPALRHRPADFSASLRRSTTYQGQERSRCSGRPGHRVARDFPRRGLGLPLCQRARSFPQTAWRQVFPSPVAQSFLSPNDRGFPQAKRLKFSLCRVAQGFLLITQLGVSPSSRKLKFSLRRWLRAFFAAHHSGFPLRNVPLKFSLSRWPEATPCGVASCQLAPGLFRGQRPQILPDTGVARGFPLAGAPDFSLPESPELSFAGGSGFPLRRLPSLAVGKFLRLSRRLHKRFRAAISRFFRRPQAIHS